MLRIERLGRRLGCYCRGTISKPGYLESFRKKERVSEVILIF